MVLDGLKFRHVSSPIHEIDPRVKFVISCIIFSVTLLYIELIPLMLLFTIQLPLVYFARVFREWSRSIRGSLLLMVMIFVLNLLFGYLSSGYQITSNTITYSVATSVRFLTLVSSFSIFFLTTSPDDLGLAMQQARIPYDFCFAFTTAVRFVPVLADEAQNIMDAQRSRGLELDKGSFLSRVRKYIPILIPLIVGAIRRSLEMAEAMESRAFGAKDTRTNLHQLEMKSRDWVILMISLFALIFSVYVRYCITIPSI
jgi:energy-coupling factor transport system permease protein